MKEGPRGAILQRDKTTYAIVPRSPVGLVTPENLENIVRVVRKYNIPIIKITSGQRLALVGMKGEDVDSVWEELQMEPGKAVELCVHYVQACPGTSVCRFGVQDSLGLGLELEKMFIGSDMPAKLKFGVSGCPMTCGESYVRDVGVVGKKDGWTLIFGGNSGGNPRIGDVLAEKLSTEQLIDLVKKAVEYFQANGKKKERTSSFIERTGIDAMKRALGLS